MYSDSGVHKTKWRIRVAGPPNAPRLSADISRRDLATLRAFLQPYGNVAIGTAARPLPMHRVPVPLLIAVTSHRDDKTSAMWKSTAFERKNVWIVDENRNSENDLSLHWALRTRSFYFKKGWKVRSHCATETEFELMCCHSITNGIYL